MMIKKWLSILIVLGFASTYVYAADDDWEEEEEEEEPVKKAVKKKASKSSDSDGPSRIGLAVDFNGQASAISLIYDMGSGLRLGLTMGLWRYTYTPDDGEAPDPQQLLAVGPIIEYSLGKGLLDYGVGVVGAIVSDSRNEEGVMISGFPNFYANVDLVKNVTLDLMAGIMVKKNPQPGATELTIDLATRVLITFYFL